MARDWEQTFRNWSKPSSDTEQQKAENAECMISDAIGESGKLSARKVQVFAQGSYKNNTNVREDSDVDICVCCYDSLFDDFSFANGLTRANVGLSPATYLFPQFKNNVEEALVAKFGRAGVTRGNKAFDVHANSYRIDADVVPCFEHRRYWLRNGQYGYISGTQFSPENGGPIINWPKQQHEKGVEKNNATGSRFKFMVRVLKRLRNEMANANIAEANPISSFLIECLVWNVPNACFGSQYYAADMRCIIAHTFNATKSEETCKEWGEVSELKYLFRLGQPWTREQVNVFLLAVWRYVGFQ